MKLLPVGGCVVGFVLAYAVFVLSPTGRRLEDATLLPPDLTNSLGAISPGLIAIGIVLVLAVGVLQQHWRETAAAAVLMAASISIAWVLKEWLHRPESAGNSYPGGHVTACAAIVLGAILVLPRDMRPVALAPGAVLTSYVAAATAELGWHRLSDTIGALALCGAVAAALSDGPPARWAAITGAIAPIAAVLAGYVAVASTTSSDLVIVATGAIAAGTMAAVALPLCAQPRATADTRVAAGYDGTPTYPV
ncbi:phosphatase PAP2 family protein [Kutzneria sp. NPDC052558]|uniref:phosphatase PAP2 family protein n=1 Tax=Kutzneria sp. NPDC052558 TaxID=3364121 RepID=UPI0037C632D7